MCLACFLDCLKLPGDPNVKYTWLWESWTSPPTPEIMNMKGFLISLKRNRKFNTPKGSRIIIRSFLALYLIIFTVDMPKPKIHLISWPHTAHGIGVHCEQPVVNRRQVCRVVAEASIRFYSHERYL